SESARTPSGLPAEGAFAWARNGPTVLRIALGAQLRRLREASDTTTGQAAEAIRATHSKISRLERGRSAARQRHVADLLTLYPATDPAHREQTLPPTRQAATPARCQRTKRTPPRGLDA